QGAGRTQSCWQPRRGFRLVEMDGAGDAAGFRRDLRQHLQYPARRVYRQPGLGLTPVASNDDYGGGTQSKLTFQAQQGTTYFIAVDGYNNGFGPLSGGITLSLSVSIPVTPGTSALVFFSHPGDWIGQGESRQIYADQAGVSITAARNFQQGVTVSIRTGAEWWDLNVGPPPGAGAPLGVGAYENAVRYPFNSGLTPGIDLSGNSRDCSSIRGRFDVLE